MKIFFLGALIILFMNDAPQRASLTKSERVFVVNYLNETSQYLANAVKGLSSAQMQFKPGPDRWSIAQCLEHIALSETGIFSRIEALQKQPADAAKRSEIKYTDAALTKALVDRSQKATAPESLQPSGKYQKPALALSAFLEQRKKTTEWIGTTNEDLRDHVMPHPFFGMLDSYQWVLLSAGHGKRHSLQIEEVKADPNFPKN